MPDPKFNSNFSKGLPGLPRNLPPSKPIDVNFNARQGSAHFGVNSLDKQMSRFRLKKTNKDVTSKEAGTLKGYIRDKMESSYVEKDSLNRIEKKDIHQKLLSDFRSGDISEYTYKKFKKLVDDGF